MNLDNFITFYTAIGITIWLVVMMRDYSKFSASEMLMLLIISIIFWPVMIVAALLRLFVFRHYDQDED